jgi:hypothetical protein
MSYLTIPAAASNQRSHTAVREQHKKAQIVQTNVLQEKAAQATKQKNE